MSGPKCYRYEVVEDPAVVAARIEAQALHVARSRVTCALARLGALHAEAEGYRSRHGDAIGAIVVPAAHLDGPSSRVGAEASRLEHIAAETEKRLRAEIGDARKTSFIAQLAGDGAAAGTIGTGLDRLRAAVLARAAAVAAAEVAEVRTATADKGVAAAAAREEFLDECARVYSRVRDDVSEAAAEDVEQTLSRTVAAAGSDRASLLVDRLRAAVTAANAGAVAREERVARIDDLLRSLGSLDVSDSDRLRTVLIAERETGRSVEVLAAEVGRARASVEGRAAQEVAERQRERVAEALGGALAELGYSIEEGFDTALAGGGTALARRAGWHDHAVRAVLDPTTDELRLHVVRGDAPQSLGAEDVARERELCDDRPGLERALAARGVRLEALELVPPGVVPVAVVSFATAAFRPSRRRATVEGQEHAS